MSESISLKEIQIPDSMQWQEKLLWAFSRLLSRLSIRSIERLASLLCWVSFDILRLRRKLILKNLDIAFGSTKTQQEKLKIAKTSVFNFILTAFEFLRSPYHPISAKIRFQDKSIVEEALSEGNGLYMLCMHMGNWEAHSPAISNNICPVYLAVKKVGSKSVNRFVETLREHNNFLWIKRKQKGDAYKAMLSILGRNEIAGFVFDQARPGEPRLPFFGKEAKTNTSFAAIRKKRPAPVVFTFAERTAFGEHTVRFFKVEGFSDSGDFDQDVITDSIMLNRVLEKVISDYPSHYFWFHNRWK